MFCRINYFSKGDGICANDLRNEIKTDIINLTLLSSVSGLEEFVTPLSVQSKGKYSVLTMNNGDKYFINEKSYTDVTLSVVVNRNHGS